MDNEKCNNPNCENELVHTEGRRKKKYCSAACKNKINTTNYFERNKHEIKTVKMPIDEYKKLLEQIAENNKPENKERILNERNGVDSVSKGAIQYPIEVDDLPRIKGEGSLDYRVRRSEWIANGRK